MIFSGFWPRGCYAFVYVVLMYEAIWRSFGRKVRLSEQQIIDHFSIFVPDQNKRVYIQPPHLAITEYIKTHGLLMNFCFPRVRVFREFRMPHVDFLYPVARPSLWP